MHSTFSINSCMLKHANQEYISIAMFNKSLWHLLPMHTVRRLCHGYISYSSSLMQNHLQEAHEEPPNKHHLQKACHGK